MGIDVLEHTERQLSFEEATQLYASLADEVAIVYVTATCLHTVYLVIYSHLIYLNSFIFGSILHIMHFIHTIIYYATAVYVYCKNTRAW